MGSYYGAGTKPPMLIGQQDLGVKIKPYLTYDDPGGGSDTASNASDEDILSDYINQMYTRFAPQEVAYDTRDEAEIRSSVAEWLRPSYDQAIANRQEQTRANKANLDADAIARGMGKSTYVSDVKNRQQNAEASDIASLEADYGSNLAKYVLDGVDSEQDRALEAEKFNAQQRQSAYDQAYSAALALYAQYKKSGGKSGQSGPNKTTLENCEAFSLHTQRRGTQSCLRRKHHAGREVSRRAARFGRNIRLYSIDGKIPQ